MEKPNHGKARQRLERVLNFRVSPATAQQIETLIQAGELSHAKSVDQAARTILVEALSERMLRHNLSNLDVDKIQSFELLQGDALTILRQLPERSFDCCITSPPYYRQRDYRHPRQIGQEKTPEEFINRLVDIFMEVHRVLVPSGTLWLVLDDSYWKKRLQGIPWRVVLKLQEKGWWLRADNIWSKRSTTTEPVKDRTTRSHEYVFLLSKQRNYFYDYESVLEPHTNPWAIDCIKKAQAIGHTGRPRSNPFDKEGRRANGSHGITRAEYGALMNPNGKNKRSVWTVNTERFRGDHSSVFPEALIEPCVRAGCPTGGRILDPFCGTGTTGVVALTHQRRFVGIELIESTLAVAKARIQSAPRTSLERESKGH